MILSIDSSDNLKTVIKLGDNEYVTDYESPREQNVLGAITEALEKENKKKEEISGIKIVTGPGSFTGLRVGISIANALSYSLKVPINNLKPGEIVIPEYGKEPNVSS